MLHVLQFLFPLPGELIPFPAMQTYRKVVELLVAALRVHVGKALHVLQLPLPFPVAQRLVHIVLLHQHHVRNLHKYIKR